MATVALSRIDFGKTNGRAPAGRSGNYVIPQTKADATNAVIANGPEYRCVTDFFFLWW